MRESNVVLTIQLKTTHMRLLIVRMSILRW